MKYVIIFIVFIFLISFLVSKHRFVNFNKDVYKWHCQNVYPFHKKLTKIENDYIKKCIQLSHWELLRPFYCIPDSFIKRLSYFTYSHRVINGALNSSRVAYGSVIQPQKAYKYALKVLKERNIKCELFPDNNLDFGGLGWDIKNNHFKGYFRFHTFKQLSETYKKLLPHMNNNNVSGLLSITYVGGKIVERKIYCYPKNEMVAKLKSQSREEIQQDCDKKMKWENKLDITGKNIVRKYKSNNYELDAITYKDKNNYTIYFPMIG